MNIGPFTSKFYVLQENFKTNSIKCGSLFYTCLSVKYYAYAMNQHALMVIKGYIALWQVCCVSCQGRDQKVVRVPISIFILI